MANKAVAVAPVPRPSGDSNRTFGQGTQIPPIPQIQQSQEHTSRPTTPSSTQSVKDYSDSKVVQQEFKDVYGRIDGVAEKVAQDLRLAGKELEKLDEKLDEKVEQLQKNMDNRFQAMDNRVDARFEAVNKRFEEVDKRFDRLETMLSKLLEQQGIPIITHTRPSQSSSSIEFNTFPTADEDGPSTTTTYHAHDTASLASQEQFTASPRVIQEIEHQSNAFTRLVRRIKSGTSIKSRNRSS